MPVNEMTRANVLQAVLAERERQDGKWGDQTQNSDEHWTVILTEEVGEVAREVYENEVLECLRKSYSVQRCVWHGEKHI